MLIDYLYFGKHGRPKKKEAGLEENSIKEIDWSLIRVIHVFVRWWCGVREFLPMRSYLNMHSPFATEKQSPTSRQATVLWLSQKPKNYIHKAVLGYLSKLKDLQKQQKTPNLFLENPWISLRISLVHGWKYLFSF